MNRKNCLLKSFALTLGFILPAFICSGQTNKSWQPSPQTIDQFISSHPRNLNFREENVPSYTLPDVLTTINGTKVTTPELWTTRRRNEILELFRENVYGRVPTTPYTESFKEVHIDETAMNGAATLKQVDITIGSEKGSLIIHLILFVPNKVSGPVPVFLLINNRGPENTDPDRKVKSEFWPAEEVISRGYAIAVYRNADVAPDHIDEFKTGIYHVLDQGKRRNDAWGALAAWAWGASRCVDYFETDKDINPKQVAVVGHSRGGKAALWAGAEDTRFSMVVSNESGCGGSALARRRFGETIERITHNFPYWFCSNYKQWVDNEKAMPLDMHMLMALIAPRALYVAAAGDDLWGDPRGSYLSLYYSLPVFRLLGTGSEISKTMPPLNKQIVSGKVGYHIRDGKHNMLLKDWNWFMDFSDKIWK